MLSSIKRGLTTRCRLMNDIMDFKEPFFHLKVFQSDSNHLHDRILRHQRCLQILGSVSQLAMARQTRLQIGQLCAWSGKD